MTEQKLEVKLTDSAFLVDIWKGAEARFFAYRPYNSLHGVVLAWVPEKAFGEKPEFMLYLKEDENWVAVNDRTKRLLRVYEPGTKEAEACNRILEEYYRYAKGGLN